MPCTVKAKSFERSLAGFPTFLQLHQGFSHALANPSPANAVQPGESEHPYPCTDSIAFYRHIEVFL